MARQRLTTTASPVRRRVLSSPAVTLKCNRRHRHEDRRLPWIFITDIVHSTTGTTVCLARLRYWRGDLVAADVLTGDPAALPPPVVERLAEFRQIAAVVAQAQGARHAG